MNDARRYFWEKYSDKKLLQVPLCDLELQLEGTWVDQVILRLRLELLQRGIAVRPHFWVSDEWLTPDGVIGVAIPFFILHPRLIAFERRFMLDVEGGTRDTCLRLLRHEMGHVVCNAYGLHRSVRWRELFGSPAKTYPEYYRPNPASRSYVQHLPGWYAQSHPDEDFAETFAVWLPPRSAWRKRYAGWPALKKLEYVNEVIPRLSQKKPVVTSRARPYSLARQRMTLHEYYQARRDAYDLSYSAAYDSALCRLFGDAADPKLGVPAGQFLRRHRKQIRDLVAEFTGESRFVLDQVLKEVIDRCIQLKLRATTDEQQLVTRAAILVTVNSAQRLYNREWHHL